MGNKGSSGPSEADKRRSHDLRIQQEQAEQASSRRQHDEKMARLRAEQEKQRLEKEKQLSAQRAKEKAIELERQLKIEEEKAKRERAKIVAEAKKQQDKQAHEQKLKEMDQKEKELEAKRKKLEQDADIAHQEAMEKLKQAEAEREAKRAELEQKRKIEHEKVLEKLELEKIAKKKEIEAQEQKHQEELKQMQINAEKENVDNQKQQRDEALVRLQTAIVDWEKQKLADEGDLAKIKEELTEATEILDVQNKTITDFDKIELLKEERKTMDDTEKRYKRNDDEILATIMKTGVNEDSIGRFLKLTHRLIGDTVSTQEEASKLNAELATFGTMINRECQDKLSIDYYFKEKNLARFAPILLEQNYNDLQDLECKDDDEFEDIVDIINKDIKKKKKIWNTKHAKNNEPDEDDEENLELLLIKYGLKKYISSLKKAGLTGLNDIDDDYNETVTDLIEETKMNKIWGKKLKKACKDYRDGKWVVPQKTKADNDEKSEQKMEKKEEKQEEKDDEPEPEPKEILRGEERKLRNIALDSNSWKTYQKEKQQQTKVALKDVSPLLGDFFSKMYQGVKQAQTLLSYNDELNNEQQEAILMLMESTAAIEPPKAIEVIDEKKDKEPIVNEPDDDEKKEDIIINEQNDESLPDYEQRKQWKKDSECQVYSKSQKHWYDGLVLEVEHDKQGEWLNVSYEVDNRKTQLIQIGRFSHDIRDKLVMTTSAVNAAAVLCVSVKDSMSERFNQSSLTKRALAVATGVEESCKQIIKCQAQIRQSVMLAGSILKLKPGNLTKQAEPLWDAVDKGIIRILKCALDMTTITSQYFGFFLRFNQSFNRFVSMYEQDQNVSLLVSLEHVKNDISEFSKFKETFNKQVQELSKQAMDVITNCVKTHIGADQWKLANQAREESLAAYLEAKEAYDKKALKLEDDLQQLYVKRTESKAKEARLVYEQERLQDSITRNKQYIKNYRETKIKLNQIVYK